MKPIYTGPPPGPPTGGFTYRWSFDSASLSKTISMVSDRGSLLPKAVGRSSFADTVQVFGDHYIVAAFETKKVHEVKIVKKVVSGSVDSTSFRLIQTDDNTYFSADYTFLPSGDCMYKNGYNSTPIPWVRDSAILVRDGESMTLVANASDSLSLTDVLQDGVSMGQKLIVARTRDTLMGVASSGIRLNNITAPLTLTLAFNK